MRVICMVRPQSFTTAINSPLNEGTGRSNVKRNLREVWSIEWRPQIQSNPATRSAFATESSTANHCADQSLGLSKPISHQDDALEADASLRSSQICTHQKQRWREMSVRPLY